MLFEKIAVVDENGRVLNDMYLLVENGRIAQLGPWPPQEYTGPRYDGRGKLALPGFYNLHCHAAMTLLRGYGEGLPLHRWLTEKMFPFEALLTEEDVYWGTLLGVAEMLQSGAVSFTDMYAELAGVVRAVDESGIKANISYGAMDDEGPFATSEACRQTCEALATVRGLGHKRIVVDAAIHAEYTSGEKTHRAVAEFAKENGLRMQVHLSETQKEHEECKARNGGATPARVLADAGVFDVPATAAHCVFVEDEDLELLAWHHVTAAHCPSSNLKLGSGIMPLKKLWDTGVAIGIGTDGAASNNNLDLREEVNLAALLHKGVQRDPLFPNMRQVLQMAAQNGAAAQGRTDCGALRQGNKADIVVYDLHASNLQPVHNALSNVLYAAGSGNICLNMVDGKVLYKDGEFATIDMEKVLFHANRIKNEKTAKLQGEL